MSPSCAMTWTEGGKQSSLAIYDAAALLRRINVAHNINNNNMQKYVLGTIVSKEFAIPGRGQKKKLQHFKGKVKAYNPKNQLYRIIYEDGDEEEMDERDISLHLVGSPKKIADEAAEALIEMANSPPRDSQSRTITSLPGGNPLPPFSVDGRLKRRPSMASLFDSDCSDEDERIGALPKLSRRPTMQTNEEKLWYESDDDAGGISKGDIVAGIHTNSREVNGRRGGKLVLTLDMPRLDTDSSDITLQSSGTKKDNDGDDGHKKKKRKAPALPMRRNEGRLSCKEKGGVKKVINEGTKQPFVGLKQPAKKDTLRLQKKKRKLGMNDKSERKMKAATLSVKRSQSRLSCNKQDGKDSDFKQPVEKATSSRTAEEERKFANTSDQLRIGDTVYAPWWNTKRRGRSYTMHRATITRIKNESTLLYDVTFDDDTRLNGIDQSMVISKHRYLNECIKPVSLLFMLQSHATVLSYSFGLKIEYIISLVCISTVRN